MARLPYLEVDDLKPEDQELLTRGINLQKILAHSPGAARAHHALGNYIRHGSTMDVRPPFRPPENMSSTTPSGYE